MRAWPGDAVFNRASVVFAYCAVSPSLGTGFAERTIAPQTTACQREPSRHLYQRPLSPVATPPRSARRCLGANLQAQLQKKRKGRREAARWFALSVFIHVRLLLRMTMENSRERNKLFASASWEIEKGSLPRPPAMPPARER